jgi:hypothetical protein
MLKPTVNTELGTCLQGYLTATYDELVAKFGPPNTEGDGWKVRAEWTLKAKNTIVTLYDWKEYGRPVADVTNWHIGGYKQKAVELIQAEFPKHHVRSSH